MNNTVFLPKNEKKGEIKDYRAVLLVFVVSTVALAIIVLCTVNHFTHFMAPKGYTLPITSAGDGVGGAILIGALAAYFWKIRTLIADTPKRKHSDGGRKDTLPNDLQNQDPKHTAPQKTDEDQKSQEANFPSNGSDSKDTVIPQKASVSLTPEKPAVADTDVRPPISVQRFPSPCSDDKKDEVTPNRPPPSLPSNVSVGNSLLPPPSSAAAEELEDVSDSKLSLEERARLAPKLKLTMSDKLLAFIHGDSFIKNSSYEGGTITSNLSFLLPYLQLREDPKLFPIINLLRELEETESKYHLQVENTPQSRAHFHQEKRKYAEELTDKIHRLKRGERFLMSGGWVTKKGGHALIYIIERTQDGRYAFSVINTGDGIEFHNKVSVSERHKTKYTPIYRLENISQSELNFEWFSSLLNLNNRFNDKDEEVEHSAKEIYKEILPRLGGVHDSDYEDRIECITAQKSGTCTWKVLMKLLQIEIGDTPAYKRLIIDLKELSLRIYFENNQELSLEQRSLLRLSTENFVRYASRHYDSSLSGDQEIIGFQDMRRVKALTNEIIQWIEEKDRVEGQRISFERKPNILSASASIVSIPVLPGKITAPRRLPKSPLADISHAPQSVEEMNFLLQQMIEHCSDLSKEGRHEIVIERIKDVVKMIPDGALEENGYWATCCKGAEKHHIETMMLNYEKITQQLFASIVGLPPDSRGSPEQMAIMWTLAATNVHITAITTKEEWAFGIVYEGSLLSWQSNPFTIFYDEKLYKKFIDATQFLMYTDKTTFVLAYPRKSDGTEVSKTGVEFNAKGGFKIYQPENLRRVLNEYMDSQPDLIHLRRKTDKELCEATLPLLMSPSFPVHLRVLFSQWCLLFYFENNPHLKKVRQEDGIGEIGIDYKHGDINVAIKGANNHQRDQEKGRKFSDHHTQIKHPGLSSLLKKIGFYSSYKKQHSLWGYFMPWSESAFRAPYTEAEEGMSSRETQMIASIFSKKETCLSSLLSYLIEYPHRLTERDFQLMIHHCLYTGDLCAENLYLFPEIGSKIISYFSDQLAIQKVAGNVQTQIYLVELLGYLSSKVRERYDDREALREIIAGINTNTDEGKQLKALALSHWVSSYYEQQHLSEEELIEITVAYFYMRDVGYDHYLSHPHVQQRIERIMDRIANSESITDQRVQKRIADRIAVEVLQDPSMQWFCDGTGRLCYSRYVINLNSFVLLESAQPRGGIPFFLSSSANFQKLFGGKSIRAQETLPGVYQFTYQEKQYRTFLSADTNRVIIERYTRSKRWETYLSHEEANTFLPQALVEEYDHWIDHVSDNYAAIKMEKQGVCLVKAHCEIEGNEVKVNIYKLRTDGEQEILCDFSTLSNQNFQKKTLSLQWTESIDFPKAQFSFAMNKEGLLCFSEDPELFLDADQIFPPTLGSISGLRLTDGKERHCFLFPREPMATKEGAIKKETTLEFDKNDGQFFRITEKEGRLVGTTVEENLFLAYLHLGKRNYEEAYHFLAPHRATNPKGYSESELEILGWIFEFIKEAKDPSIGACAVHLQLLYACQNSLSPEQKKNFELPEKIKIALGKYYPLSHQILCLAPSLEQEIELLQTCPELLDTVPGLCERYAFLQRKARGEVLEEAPSFVPDSIRVPTEVSSFLQVAGINMEEGAAPHRVLVKETLDDSLTPPQNVDLVIQKGFTDAQESIAAYRKEQNAKQAYQFSPDTLKLIEEEMGKQKKELSRDIVKLKERILKYANQPPANAQQATLYAMRRLGRQERFFSIDDLIIIYLQDNGAEIMRRNPHFTQQDVQHLASLVHEYLLHSTELTHVSRVQKAASKAEHENLDILLREKRAYIPTAENAMLLIFEYYSGFRLREAQVTLIIELQKVQGENKENMIAQLIMGSGKSKVILPLLALLNSHGNNVPMIVVPDLLYETNLEDMRVLSGEMFQQSCFTINLSEGEPLTDELLKDIEKKIETVKSQRSYFLVNATTICSLLLHFKQAAVQLAEYGSPSAELRFEKLQKILSTLCEDAIFDEADMILDQMREVNFACGRWQSIPQDTQDTVEALFQTIAENPEWAEALLLTRESKVSFDKKNYDANIKPAIIKKLGIPPDTEMFAYLLGTRKAPPQEMKGFSLEKQDEYFLLKELLNNLLPLIASENCDQHFGLSRLYNTFRAIPYDPESKLPKESSEFYNFYKTMICTTFYYARKGVSSGQIVQLVKEYREQALHENRVTGRPLQDTEAYRHFEMLQLVPGKDLFTISEQEIVEAVDIFNKDIKRRIAFSRHFGWREIGAYDRRLSCGAHHIVGLFKYIIGFTGTLWNADTFSKRVKAKPDTTIDGKTLSLLAAHSQMVVIEDVQGLYESLKNYDACIDTGAWFKGLSARAVAEEMLKHIKQDAVVYFNDVDFPPGSVGQAVILERGKAEPVLLSQTTIAPEKRFTYYNKTTGADIVQHEEAKAITTISKDMLLRDLEQGVWRMRGLDKKQTTDFAVFKALQQVAFPKKKVEEIFYLCILNQGIRQCENNLDSLKKEMPYQVEHSILQALLCLDTQAAAELSRRSLSILAPSVSIRPSELFSAVEEVIPIDILVDRLIATTMDTVRKVGLGPTEEELSKLVKWKALPEKGVLSSGNYQGQMQVQNHVQMQTQLQVVQEKQERRLGKKDIPTVFPLGNVFSKFEWGDESKTMKTKSLNVFLRERKADLSDDCDLTRDIFAQGLQISDRFAPQEYREESVLFQSGTQPVSTCALRVLPNGKLELVLLNPNEAAFLAKILESYRESYKDPTKYLLSARNRKEGKWPYNYIAIMYQPIEFQLHLVNPHVGLLSAGAPISEVELLEREDYIELCAQAKFYNGDLDSYTEKERRYLHTWIQRVGEEKMRILLANILRSRPKERQRFEKSVLGAVFGSFAPAA